MFFFLQTMVEVIPNREEFRKADAVFSLVTKVCLVLRGNGAVGGGSGARGELGTRVGGRELVAWDEIGQFMGSMVLCGGKLAITNREPPPHVMACLINEFYFAPITCVFII
jgi:hypothetical protein